MTLPDKDSPFWPIANGVTRVAMRSGVLLLGLWLFYNSLDPRDVKTILLCIFADAGITVPGVLSKVKSKTKEESEE